MTRRKSATSALEETRKSLGDTNAGIENLRRQRTDELSGNADESTLDKLDAEIKRLEIMAGRLQERITLLQAEAERAEAERRAKEKQALIEKLDNKLIDERRAAAEQIRDGIAAADAGFRKLLNIARDVQAAWPWQAHDLPPCLLAPGAIIAAIQHELYRVGARPLLHGGQDPVGAGLSFPGGKPERIELYGLPDRITPLIDVVARASQYAAGLMRGGGSSKPPPKPIQQFAPQEIVEPPQRQRTTAEAELVQLLNKQMELAEDITPEGEAAYQECVAQIARIQGVIETEKAMGAQHG